MQALERRVRAGEVTREEAGQLLAVRRVRTQTPSASSFNLPSVLSPEGRADLQSRAGAAVRATPGQVASSFVPRNIEDFRPSALMAGGTGGAAIGAPLGPVGAAAGGALGSMAAQGLFDFGAEIGRRTGVVGPEGLLQDSPNVGLSGNPTQRMLNEGAFDAAFPGAGSAIRGLRTAGKRRLAKVGESGRLVDRYAQEMGIPIGIESVTERGSLRKFRDIIGKFPFLGTYFQRSDKAVAGALRGQRDALLSEFSPVARTVAETGSDMGTAAVRRTKAINRFFRREYTDLLTRAEGAGSAVPTDRIKQVSTELVEEWIASLPQKEKLVATGLLNELGDPIEVLKRVPIKSRLNPKVLKLAEDLQNITDTITPTQYKRMAKEVNGLIDEFRDNKTIGGQALTIKYAMEQDLSNLLGDPAFREELKALDGKFSQFQRLVNSATGRKLGRAVPQIFEIGFGSPSKNVDELFQLSFNTHSPQAMREMRQLVGQVPFRRAVRRHIENVFTESVERTKDGQFLNLGVLRQKLGLGRPGSVERETLREAFRQQGAKVSLEDLDKWFAVAEAHFSLGQINMSQFLGRRLVLGGPKALIRGVVPGAVIVGGGAGGAGVGSTPLGLAIGLGAVYAVRNFAKFLSEPAALKASLRMFDDTKSLTTREAALRRMIRVLGEQEFRVFAQAIQQGEPVETAGRSNVSPLNALAELSFGRVPQLPSSFGDAAQLPPGGSR